MNAISLHSVVPIRTEPRESAEQSTQMLFGEICTVLEQKPRWNRIKLESDGQEGWVDAKMIAPMSDKEYTSYKMALDKAATVTYPLVYAVSENNRQTIPLTAGTKLTNYEIRTMNFEGREVKTGHFEVLGVGFRIESYMVITQSLELNMQNLLQTARFFLNVPYLWGGKNALGMDCSGFTQVVMGLFGKRLLRNASEQVTQGMRINQLSDAQAGDLAFFDHEGLNDGTTNPKKISHVGIVIDPQRIIHCSGRVKVEKLDETGIFNPELGGYSHHLAQIRRV